MNHKLAQLILSTVLHFVTDEQPDSVISPTTHAAWLITGHRSQGQLSHKEFAQLIGACAQIHNRIICKLAVSNRVGQTLIPVDANAASTLRGLLSALEQQFNDLHAAVVEHHRFGTTRPSDYSYQLELIERILMDNAVIVEILVQDNVSWTLGIQTMEQTIDLSRELERATSTTTV